MTVQSLTAQMRSPATPSKAVSIEGTLVASAALAGSGAFTASGVIPIQEARRITLEILYNTGTTGGYPHIVPNFSGLSDVPAVGDDAWYVPAVWDSTVTAVSPGAVATGVDYTVTPPFGEVVFRPLLIRSAAATGASDKIRMVISIDTNGARWFYVSCAEKGVTGTPGTLAVYYTLSV